MVTKDIHEEGFQGRWVSINNFEQELTILYCHGGGFTVGSALTHQNFASRLASQAGAKSLVLNLSLAPEHPYPKQLQETLKAYDWLLGQMNPDNIVLAGDSSGATLVLSALGKMVDAATPLPRSAVLVSPWTDLTHSGPSIQALKQKDPMVQVETLKKWALNYAPEDRLQDPFVSPCFRDLTGFPPMLVCVSDSEILYSDSTRLYDKAKAAGVPITMITEKRALHVWPIFHNSIPEGRKTLEVMAQFMVDFPPSA